MPTRDAKRWWILGVICLAQLTVLLDNTVLNVAVPSLSRELGASTADVQWMLNAYSLVQSGLLLTAGSMADRYGRRRCLLLGLAVFGLGSLGASLSQTPGQLIVARAGMGIGGALLVTTTLAVLVQVFDEAERPKAIGIWAAISSLGFAVGPVIGGFLLARFWWGSVFLINLPVAVLGFIAVAKLVPESAHKEGDRPDLAGAALSTVGMVGVVWAVISIPRYGWVSGRVSGLALLGLLGLAAFAVRERRTPYPMLDVTLFRNRRFTGAVSGGILVAFGMGGSLFLLTQHLQFVLGYGPLQAGLRIAPLALTVILLNLLGIGARVLAKTGASVAIIAGMTLLAAGLASIAAFADSGYGGTLAGLILIGAGVGLAMPAMANAIMGAIPPERAGMGSGVNGTLQEFGNGLGVAVLGAILSARYAAGLPHGLGPRARDSLPAAQQLAAHRPDGAALAAAARHAFSSGLSVSQLLGAAAVLAGGLVAGVLLHRADRPVERTSPAERVPVG